MFRRIKQFLPAGRGSIRRRLMAWGLALLGAALVINTIAGSIYTRRQIRKTSAELQFEVASLTANRVHALMLRKIERLQDLAVAMSLHPMGGEEQKLLGLLLLKNDRSFTELAILNESGSELLKFSERRVYLPADLGRPSDSAPFQLSTQGEFYISEVRPTDQAEPYVTMAVPLKAGPRTVVGVLVAKGNLKFLWDLIANSQFSSAGYCYLVDQQGKLIAHRDPSLVLKSMDLRAHPKVRQFLQTRSGDSEPGAEAPGINGQAVLSTYAAVTDLGWAVVAEEPVGIALAELGAVQRHALLLLVFGLLAGAGVIVWVSAKITRPIQQLRAGVRTIRAGNLQHRANIQTSDEIQELAEEFNQMTAALQNSYASLEQQVQERTQAISALYDISTTINQSLELDSVLRQVIKKITEIFRFSATRIFLLNPQESLLELRASFAANAEQCWPKAAFEHGEGIIGRAAESGEPMIFEDIATDPGYARLSFSRATKKAGFRFVAVFPIKTQSRVLGAIVFNGDAPRRLTADETRLIGAMAEHLGVAAQKASLYRQSAVRAQHLAVLNRIGAAVSRSLDLDIILREAVDKIAEALSFDAAWIYQLDPADRQLHMRAYRGLGDEMAKSMATRSIKMGISGQVMESGQRLVFEDIRHNALYQELTRGGKVVALGFHTASAFPIRAKGKVIGTLHVANRTMRHFAPDELQLIESIAQEIGVAVENATLFTELKEKTIELAKMNQELLQATHAKSEFIAAMSHELRTPLHVIIGNADLTSDGFFGELNPEQQKALQKISRNAQVLLKMINNVLAFSEPNAKRMTLEISTVEVEDLIAHARAHVEQINRDNQLEVRWDVDRGIPTLRTDALKLEEILHNIIGNAFKFTTEGGIDVRVRNLAAQERVEFSIADTGIGIEPEDLHKIFDEFEQIKEAHTGQFDGVGLGLSIVKKYLELMQGEIHVESRPGYGSTFTFSVPVSMSHYPDSALLTSGPAER
jgi:signal transduction histidine kinase